VTGSFGVLRGYKGGVCVTRVTNHEVPRGSDDVISKIAYQRLRMSVPSNT